MVDEIEDIFIDPAYKPGQFYKSNQDSTLGNTAFSNLAGSTLYKPGMLEN